MNNPEEAVKEMDRRFIIANSERGESRFIPTSTASPLDCAEFEPIFGGRLSAAIWRS